MAKIDTSVITGFDAMSVEQKLAALMAFDVPEPDMSGFVRKDVFDAKATEAANLTKQLRARMSDEEAAKIAAEAAHKELEDKYNELLKKNTISGYKAKYLAIGYDEKLASETAEALANGDMEKVFENGEKHKSEMEKKIKADILKGTPKPGGGSGGEPMTLDKISKIKDPAERQAAIADNLELYGIKN